MKHLHLAVASLVLAGCVVDDETDDRVEVSETAQDVIVANGMSLNGMSLNGMSLNGTALAGKIINSASTTGRSASGGTMIATWGTTLTSSVLASLVSSTWTATLSDGTTLPLRIDTAAKGTGIASDIGMYGVSYQSSAGWQPLCGYEGSTAVLAVVVAGTWSYLADVAGGGAYTTSTTQMTFACRGKAIAKCLEFGYKPWTGRVNQLAACTRMMRGDFCGNGHSYTVDGTQLNLYDNVGLQSDTAAWVKEAEWTINGARCVNLNVRPRFLQ
ncbi:MAG: ADYC domain-containing protein, partial [Kofleriaceae bacterium]